ncbi:MAG TPA: beta-ketoacyl reductase, partial [Solirubrobacteraceae bacterium]
GLPSAAHECTHAILRVLQSWFAEERLSDSLLVILTRGSVAVAGEDLFGGLSGTPVWGMARSAQAEYPGRLVLADIDGARASVDALAAALESGESQLAIRDGQLFLPRLARTAPEGPVASRAPSSGAISQNGGSPAGRDLPGEVLDGDRLALITGGTGGLGAIVARHLVAVHGARHLLLTSRRGRDAPGARELERELAGLGAHVRIEACDVSDYEQLRVLLDSIEDDHPLGAVVHVAGTGDNGLLEALTPESVSEVFAPKLDAAWHLHELTEHLDLQAFVLYSSIAGLFGGPGQGNYAAANAFLDGLAAFRRARGLNATSIVWGLWSEAGMGRGLSNVDVRRVLGSSSMRTIPTREGLELFDLALASGEGIVFPARLDGGALRAEARAGTLPGLLRGLVRVPARATTERPDGFKQRLSSVPEDERAGIVLELVRTEVASVLGHASPAAVEPAIAFRELGFDSLAAVELRNRLNDVCGLSLHATVVFDYPTAGELAGHLLELLTSGGLAGESGVDARIDELELMLSTVAGDGGERERLAARLRTCLSALYGDGGNEDIDIASDEELFELIDKGLGAR